ncbi:MAG: hypothetical protein FWG99_09485 [Treponema sp.]|nr:hypothetical protein [Treponema sp.]
MKNFRKIGAFSAFYLSAAYIIGMVIFIFAFDYLNIDPSQKLIVLINNQALAYFTNLILYIFFGFFLIILILSLYNRFKNKSPIIMQIFAVIGIIWAGLLISSGLVANAGINPTAELFQKDPEQAQFFWLQIETVANGLSCVTGEILGGLMTILLSIAGICGHFLRKSLNYYGVLVGGVGIITIIPVLHNLGGVFGITQLIWFIWLGVLLLKSKEVD